jgi:thioredoxin-dependent peroxiredoxin
MDILERMGEAFEGDERLTILGRKLQPEDPAPEFALVHLSPTGSTHIVHLRDTADMVRLLNVVNSLDKAGHMETRHWEALRTDLPPGVAVYTVSMDLPHAGARWRPKADLMHQILSAHQSEQFGLDYGVLIKEWRLLQRSVFVINRRNRIAHAEYVADQHSEPNYAAAMEAVRKVAPN